MFKLMIKIDLKDRKILYELDLNSRQSLSKISKKVGLPKNVIKYRIERLKDRGIIKKFYTHIDAYRLGYLSFRLYFSFQYTTPEIENEIINYFINNPNIWRVITIYGRFDLGVTIWVKDNNSFYTFWKKTMEKYGDYFTNETFSACIQSLDYHYSYLLQDDYKKSDRELYELTGGGKITDIDKKYKKILNYVGENARASLREIGEGIDASPPMVNYRLKELQNLGIIQGFRTDIDISKLDYIHIKSDVYLREYKQRNKIIRYIKYNPHMIHISTSSGISDIEFEFHVRNIQQVFDIMSDLVIKFPNIIRKYQYFTIKNVFKIRYMPEI